MCRRPTRRVFEVGRNVATTEGAVVFENELFQLIEYKPLTAKVHERPMLFVPPCINKYYILDLQPENSLIRYAVDQGHRTFVVSWRNPDESLKGKTWDDYIEDGAVRAVEVVQDLCGAKTINTLGFCVGGTILSTALAVLAARGQQPAHSVTLLTTLLDFDNTGVLDLFVDEASVQIGDGVTCTKNTCAQTADCKETRNACLDEAGNEKICPGTFAYCNEKYKQTCSCGVPIPQGDCSYNDQTYKQGEQFKATDGCNTCVCRDGKAYCGSNSCDVTCDLKRSLQKSPVPNLL